MSLKLSKTNITADTVDGRRRKTKRLKKGGRKSGGRTAGGPHQSRLTNIRFNETQADGAIVDYQVDLPVKCDSTRSYLCRHITLHIAANCVGQSSPVLECELIINRVTTVVTSSGINNVIEEVGVTRQGLVTILPKTWKLGWPSNTPWAQLQVDAGHPETVATLRVQNNSGVACEVTVVGLISWWERLPDTFGPETRALSHYTVSSLAGVSSRRDTKITVDQTPNESDETDIL